MKTYIIFLRVEKIAFDSKIFPIKFEGTGFSDKVSDYSNLKLLTHKQMVLHILKFIKRNKTNHVFFLLSKRNR